MCDQRERLAAFQPEDAAFVIEREVSQNIARYKQPCTPRAVPLAGQPGAGKTVLSTMMAETFDGNAVLINGDEYRRYHPNFWHPKATPWR